MTIRFSYVQREYHELKEHARRLGWNPEKKHHIYNNCDVDVIDMEKNKVRIIIRRKKVGYSSFAEKIKKNPHFKLNLMMGFIVTKVTQSQNPFGEFLLKFVIEQNKDDKGNNHEDDVHRNLEDVQIISDDEEEIKSLKNLIEQKMQNPSKISNIFHSGDFDTSSEIIPVVYQPEVDTSLNFLRDIQVNKQNSSYEVTLVFNGEILRKHGVFDIFYKIYRFFKYKRTLDIESFKIENNKFIFGNIYSGDNTLFQDSIHEKNNADIKYYFQDSNHPIVFVNTSNHALAEKDNNHDFWKREYVPWSDKVPTRFGNETNENIEKQYEKYWWL